MKHIIFLPIISIIIASPSFMTMLSQKGTTMKTSTLRKCYIKENIRTSIDDSVRYAQSRTYTIKKIECAQIKNS